MKLLLFVFVMTSVFSVSYAGRGKKQQKRIEQGIESGELNERETNRLNAQQDRIKDTRKEYRSDGVLDDKEKKSLNKKRNKASKNIHKQKHD
jgi:hypothetical protein